MKFFKNFGIHTFLLILVFLAGLFLRLYNQKNHLWTAVGYDAARDMLVAGHILNYGEIVSRGPEAFGGANILINSPVYYYVIAIFWFFSGNPVQFIFLWSLFLSAQILIAYKVGKNFLDENTGLLFAALIAFSPELIYESKNLYQPYFLPFFSLVFLYYMVKKRKKLFEWFLALFFLLFPLHLHYGVLLIIPFGFVWIFYQWFFVKEKDDDVKTKTNTLFLCLFFVLMIISWVFVSYNHYPFEQINFINYSFSNTHQINLLSNFFSAVVELSKSILRTDLVVLFICLLVIVLFGSIVLLLKTKRSEILFLMLLILSPLVASFSQEKLYDIYFLSIFPFFMFLLSLVLHSFFTFNKKYGIFFFVAVISFFLFVHFKEEQLVGHSYYEEINQLSLDIYSDFYLRSKSESDYIIAVLSSDGTFFYDGWGTTPFWISLEKTSKSRLVKITDIRSDANHYPLNISPDYVYFICEHRVNRDYDSISACLNLFTMERDFLDSQAAVISKSQNFTVYKFKITEEYPDRFYRYYVGDGLWKP